MVGDQKNMVTTKKSIATRKEDRQIFKIILADDHGILREGVRSLIEKKSGYEVVGEAVDGEELMRLVDERPCDLIIVDLSMPQMDGLKAIGHIRKSHTQIKVLILTMHKNKMLFRKAVSAGVHGYLLKDDASDELYAALKQLRAGKKFYSWDVMTSMVDDYEELITRSLASSPLTAREESIVRLIGRGKNSAEIATDLDISKRTVETHHGKAKARKHGPVDKVRRCKRPHLTYGAGIWSKIGL